MGQAESKDPEKKPSAQHGDRKNTHGEQRSRRTTPPVASVVPQPPAVAPSSPRTPSAPGRSRAGPSVTPKTFPKTRPLSGLRSKMTPAVQQSQETPTLRTRQRVKQQFAFRPKPNVDIASKKLEPSKTPAKPTPVKTITPITTPAPVSKPGKSQPIPISKSANKARPVRPRARRPIRRSAPSSRVSAQTAGDDSEEKSPPAKRVTRGSSRPSSPPDMAVASPESAMSLETEGDEIGDQVRDTDPDRTDGKMSASSESDRIGEETDDDDDDDEDDELDGKADVNEEPAAELDDLSDDYNNEAAENDAASTSSESAKSEALAPAMTTRPTARRREPAARDQDQFMLRRSRRLSVPVRRLQVDPAQMVYISV